MTTITKIWQPVAIPNCTEVTTTLADIRVGGTFEMDGQYYRKFEGGIRRQLGRAPKQLTKLPHDTVVRKIA